MKQLREKASEGPSATRIEDVDEGDSFTLENPALYGPDEVSGEDEYPYYGDWFSLVEDGEQVGFLECPRSLAQEVVRVVDHDDLGFPMSVTIEHVELADEEWRIDVDAEEAE